MQVYLCDTIFKRSGHASSVFNGILSSPLNIRQWPVLLKWRRNFSILHSKNSRYFSHTQTLISVLLSFIALYFAPKNQRCVTATADSIRQTSSLEKVCLFCVNFFSGNCLACYLILQWLAWSASLVNSEMP